MSQKSSVPQPLIFVSRVLTPDRTQSLDGRVKPGLTLEDRRMLLHRLFYAKFG
jgi:hypothetical protein